MTLGWNILPQCFRCVYSKSRNYAIILDGKTKEMKVLVKYDTNGNHKQGKTYARRGNCIGYLKCGKCPDEEFTLRDSVEGPPGPLGCFFIEVHDTSKKYNGVGDPWMFG